MKKLSFVFPSKRFSTKNVSYEKNKVCIQSIYISKGDNSRWADGQMAGQTNAQAPLPALYTSSDGNLSMYQVSFNSLLYFQRYAMGKRFIAKIKKGSNSIKTGDRFMVLAFCNTLHGPLSVY